MELREPSHSPTLLFEDIGIGQRTVCVLPNEVKAVCLWLNVRPLMWLSCFHSGPDLTGGPEQLRHPVRDPPDGGFPVQRTAGCALQRVDSGKVRQLSVAL